MTFIGPAALGESKHTGIGEVAGDGLPKVIESGADIHLAGVAADHADRVDAVEEIGHSFITPRDELTVLYVMAKAVRSAGRSGEVPERIGEWITIEVLAKSG